MANAEINPALANDLKARLSFVGNLMAGHAWFKITNLALSDTKDYGVVIQELKQGPPESMQSVHLKVIGNAYQQKTIRTIMIQNRKARIEENRTKWNEIKQIKLN